MGHWPWPHLLDSSKGGFETQACPSCFFTATPPPPRRANVVVTMGRKSWTCRVLAASFEAVKQRETCRISLIPSVRGTLGTGKRTTLAAGRSEYNSIQAILCAGFFPMVWALPLSVLLPCSNARRNASVVGICPYCPTRASLSNWAWMQAAG